MRSTHFSSIKNDTGATSSYEARRGGEYMEMLNAAEVFGRIMIEYDYPECTTACVTALSLFHKHWPEYRTADIKKVHPKGHKLDQESSKCGWELVWKLGNLFLHMLPCSLSRV